MERYEVKVTCLACSAQHCLRFPRDKKDPLLHCRYILRLGQRQPELDANLTVLKDLFIIKISVL